MTSQTTAKIRLVKCPKCINLLEEPDNPIYQCGGCGTILQAKNRKADIKESGWSPDGTDVNQKMELDCIEDQKEINNLDQAATSSAGGESSPDTSNSRNQDDFQDHNGKQPGNKNLPHELPSSLGLNCQKNDAFSPEVREQIEQVGCEYSSDQNTHGHEKEFGDSKRNWSRGRSYSDDFYSSVEFPCRETEDSSPELQTNIAFGESSTTSDHCASKIPHENCIREQHEDNNILGKISSLIEDKHDESECSPKGAALEEEGNERKCLSLDVDSANESKFEGYRDEFPKNSNSSREISSAVVVVPEKPSTTSSIVIVPEKQSPVVDTNAEVEEVSSAHNCDSLKAEDTLNKKETDSSDADENSLDESIPSDIDDSRDDQQQGASKKMIPFVDTLDSLPLVNLSSDLGLKNVNMSKSPTRNYYGNDGSPSSYDGFGDRIPVRFTKPPRKKSKHAKFNNSKGLHREDGPLVNENLSSNHEMQDQPIFRSGAHKMLSSESEVQHQARESSILPEKYHPTMKYRNQQDDLHDPRSYGHSIGSRMRKDKGEYVSKLPFSPKYSMTGDSKWNPSHYSYNVFQHYSGFCSPDAPSHTEPDRLELLRMVEELKGELNRMHISNSTFPPRVIREEKYTPLFYDHHLVPCNEISADLCHSRYPGRYSQGKVLPHSHKVQRMVFSGDATNYRRHVDCACLHCHLQDWHCSVQLPSRRISCNKVHCTAHSSACYNGQCSTSSSPQHYKSSEFSVSDRETKFDDQRHRDNAMKKIHLRERYQLTKRHLRPVAGGTPIVACYHCSELLQLPADFLLLGRRCHKLRCNACRKVTKFSLQSSTHLVPCIADAVAPPPSMVDDCSESIRQRNWASASHSNNNPYAEPLSCTDDYGISFDRSCSTEGEPLLITPPLQTVERNSQNIKSSLGNSVMPLGDRKMKSALGECQQTHTDSAENLGSVGSSSKRSKWRPSSSEIKEVRGSPLHRLMGYSSPSGVMRN